MELSPQLQNQIGQYQQLQQQLEGIMIQKTQVVNSITEIKNALEELEGADEDASVYKMAGSVIIKAKNRKAVMDDLSERLELLEVRNKGLEKQEEQLTGKAQELQETISKAVERMQGGAGPQPPVSG